MISVIICSHNPKLPIFYKVLDAIRVQDLDVSHWELIIVDNSSDNQISKLIDISWHPQGKFVVEEKLGLANARLRSSEEANFELFVFVDDDNLLAPNYLSLALDFHQKNPKVGCFGGKSIPQFETPPPQWFFETGINLGCQEFGNNLLISDYSQTKFPLDHYPNFAPIGTGMVITKNAFLTYIKEVKCDKTRLEFGRRGEKLISGEDNDIILTIIKNNFEIAYLPSLLVEHLIPQNRYSFNYLKKMSFESNRSWVKVLALHQINLYHPIARATLKFREISAFFKLKAWESELNYLRWLAACGIFKGRSEI